MSQKEAVETWGSDPEEKRPTGVYNSPTLRYSGMTQKGRELGLSIDSMGEKLAELGYLPKDEHGKYDVRDFENAFRVGDEHYTPSGIERRAALSDEMRYQEEMAKYKESAQDIVDLVPEADSLDNANLHFALDASEKMAHDVDWSSLKLTDDSDFMRAMGFTEKEINEDRNQAVRQSEPGQSAGREQAESDQSNAKAGTETSREAGGREGQEVNLPRYDSEFSRPNKPQTPAEPAKPQTHSDILREAADKMDALTNPTKAALEAKQREQEQAIADKAKSDKEAEQRLQADLDRNDFKLSGSNRPADVREANGQTPLFSRLKETENRNGLNNFHNDDVSLGRSRMAETQPSPKDGTHRAYDILDTPLLKTLDRSIPKDQRQAQAKVGDVLLSHDAEGNITSLKNIEIFPSKQGRTWGEKTVSSILASLPEGKTLKIEDIKPDAVGFWDKMGAKFPRSEHGMEADLSYQQYKDKYENRLADKERDFFNDGGTSGTPSFNRTGHEDSSGNQADRGRTGRRGENDSGLTVDAAREAAQPLLDKFPRLKSSIEFVKSADDVPHNAVANDARGVYVGDKIYVVADNIKNIAELTDVINHEGVGHLAVKEMLDQVKPGLHDELLKQVTLLDKSNNPIVREMADEIRETYSQPLKVPTLEESRAAATENNIKTLPGDTVKSILNRMELKGNLSADAENMVRMAKPIELNDKTVAAEVLAHMAERRMQNDEQFVGPIKGIVDRFVDALKSFGKLVFGKELSTKDLLNMLRLAENHLADSKYTGGILKASTVRAQEIMASRESAKNSKSETNNPDAQFSRAEALPREKPTEEEKSSVPIAVTKQSQDAVKELQLFLGPMAAGSDRARATTKDFANNERLARHTFPAP